MIKRHCFEERFSSTQERKGNFRKMNRMKGKERMMSGLEPKEF